MSPVQGQPIAAAPRDAIRSIRPAAGGRDGGSPAASFGDAFRRHAERPDRSSDAAEAAGGAQGDPAAAAASSAASASGAVATAQPGIPTKSGPPGSALGSTGAFTPSIDAQTAQTAQAAPAAPQGSAPALTGSSEASGAPTAASSEASGVVPSTPGQGPARRDGPPSAGPVVSVGAPGTVSSVAETAGTEATAVPTSPGPAAAPAGRQALASATTQIPDTRGIPGAGEQAGMTAAPLEVAGAGAAAVALPTGGAPGTSGAHAPSAAGEVVAGDAATGQGEPHQSAPGGTPAASSSTSAAPLAETVGHTDPVQLPPAARADLPVQQVPSAVVGAADAHAPGRQSAAPLPQQLGGPAFALAQAAADTPGGTSTITVTVAPEDLGPITIRASLSPDGARIEFFSATDGGREALKQALPDLRREASSSGLSASLDLGTGTPDDGRDRAREDTGRRSPAAENRTPTATPWTGRPIPGTSTLDLFA
ncbi:flagellar hook-length control protein FliK [Arthrobacter ruber]|uniref:flagellar hook-length control protein FliK n=1 Tax=Arthrobacter ruber TaxID=1258893 RepID=UPI000CF40387|nr:flagellar hook-length control protein FliK [Arthrobacter ruber]